MRLRQRRGWPSVTAPALRLRQRHMAASLDVAEMKGDAGVVGSTAADPDFKINCRASRPSS